MPTMKRQQFRHRWIYIILGAIITLGLLTWALRGVSPIVIWSAIQTVRWEWLALSLLTYLASFVVRAHRWGILLDARHKPGSFKVRLSAIFIGFAGNAILPASAGEMVRVAVLHRFSKFPFGVIIGSIFTERLLDAAIAFLFLFIPLLAGELANPAGLRTLPIGWIGAALAMLCVAFLVAANHPEAIAHLTATLSCKVGLERFSSRIGTAVRSILEGLAALRYPKRGIFAILESVLIWSLTALTYWTGLLAFGITSPGLIGAFFMQSVVALAIALPSSPGYVGPFEAAIRFSLSLYAVSPNTIIAYALTLRLLMFVSLTLIGYAIAAHLGLSKADFIPTKTASLDDTSEPISR
ncbi:MAG: lysylphosphatidylglycerol synthase transmembrane domain-containing protein [Leptolyngbyaceae cyanobacterium bins.302]|nr:lysylphosphatidylglycerol synthase transmembrane domain-containing protein [Leptolyngbyaceae cyanobacterium bins.302]